MLHVLQAGNKPVYKGMCLTVLSMLKNTKEPIHYHLMTIEVPWSNVPKITLEEAKVIENILKKANPLNEFTYYDISDDFIKRFENSPNKNPKYTPATLIRLMSLDYIDCDYLIYLDADTMVYNSLEEFNKYDISDYEIGVCKDYMGRFWIKHDYINAGVLYINCKKCRENHVFDRAIELLDKKSYYFSDQTAIYKATTKRLYLPFKFNEQRSVKEDTVVKHFCKGIRYIPFFKIYNIKQWNVEKVHSFLKIHEFDEIFIEYNELFPNEQI